MFVVGCTGSKAGPVGHKLENRCTQHLHYDKRQKLRISTRAPEGMEKEALPCLLGGGGGWPEISVTLARQALALGCLMFYGRLWMPHCGHRHKQDHAVTSRVHNQEGMQGCLLCPAACEHMPHMCIYTNAELQACSRGGRESAET